jgi:hypothetical protein
MTAVGPEQLLNQLVVGESGVRHDLAEVGETPRPGSRNTAVVEVPAAAAGHPHGLFGGLHAVGFEAGGSRPAGADLAAFPVAQQLDELAGTVEHTAGEGIQTVDVGVKRVVRTPVAAMTTSASSRSPVDVSIRQRVPS